MSAKEQQDVNLRIDRVLEHTRDLVAFSKEPGNARQADIEKLAWLIAEDAANLIAQALFDLNRIADALEARR